MSDPKTPIPDHEALLREAIAGDPGAIAGASAGGGTLPSIAELARRFPDLDVHELIARGGMGAVYRATQRSLDRPVAIKVLLQELASDPEFGERFLREARALASLRHPNILTVHDYGERDGLFFLVTEFVEGVNLRQLMELGELSPAEALRIAPQICTALQFAHERGVVHRDIKPENILIDTRGDVRIADFGLAKVAASDDRLPLTRRTAVLGTPHYMAPEQWRGESGAVDHRADIFALGVVLYEMLTGQLPLGDFDPPSRRRGVPRGLDDVVRRALAQQPEKRYQQVRDVRADVEKQAGELSRAAGSSNEGTQSAPFVRGAFAAPVALVLAIVAVCAAIFGIERAQRENAARWHAQRDYEARSEQVWSMLQNGDPVEDVEVPSALPDDVQPRVIGEDEAAGMLFLVAGGTFLLVPLLALVALRRIRRADGPRRGLVSSVLFAWAVPLGVLDALVLTPVVAMRNGDLRVVVGLVVVALLAWGNGWFVHRQIRRQRALREAGVPVARAGGWIAAGLVVGSMLWLLSASLPLWYGRVFPADRLVPQRGAVFAQHLVGRSVDFVLERVGRPANIGVMRGMQLWNYPGPDGEPVRAALSISGDEVVAYSSKLPVLQPGPGSLDEPGIGDRLSRFVMVHGAPTETVTGRMTQQVRFANGMTLDVFDGRVFGVRE